jgi:hypothetical protein
MGYDVVPAELVVKAMQDSGYKNAAYAIAELMDNSIQAGATLVELLCIEKEEYVAQRSRARLQQLAVLDNGCGMSSEELRRALQFGNGGHLADRSGIGRFGMGLPNSSMSQGSRVEVWSWQGGSSNASYSYLDLREITTGELKEVPKPIKKAIPKIWKTTCKKIAESGTLVVWARPDRCTWRTATAIVRNSEELVGRMYRRFIDRGDVAIRMCAFRDADLKNPTFEKYAKPNDPMYLMSETSCPEPYSNIPMFEPWGDSPSQEITINSGGQNHIVKVTFSLAKAEARQGHNPGDLPHGKHAGRNLGVSVVRADRELELDSKWMPSYDPTARWIGIEIDFPPALDEVFGVTNNKQSATHFADLAGVDKEELAKKHGYESYQALKEAWKDDADVREPLLTIKDAIESSRNALMRLLKAQTRGTRRERRSSPDSPEAKGTEATKKRIADGFKGTSDFDEGLAPEQKQTEVEEGLISEGVDKDQAHDLAVTTIDEGYKFVFGHADTNSSAFFNVKPKGGALLITLNTNHPAYENLVGLLEDHNENMEKEELLDKLNRALDGLKLLFEAWARFEDELPDGPKKSDAQDVREDWGRVARHFLRSS